MRYTLILEAIGDNYSDHVRRVEKAMRYGGKIPYNVSGRIGQIYQLGHEHPWVARITGMVDCKFTRRFIQGQRDYAKANSTGSRGIMVHYFLEPGLYEINERINWKRTKRHFAWIVNDATLCELSRQEAMEWLQVNDR